MAITKAAKKAVGSSKRKRVFNDRRRKQMRDSIKEIRNLVLEKKTDEASQKLSTVYKAIDKAAKRGVIKANTASRKKSRLTKLVNKK